MTHNFLGSVDRGRFLIGSFRRSDGRKAHNIAGFNPGVGLCPALVNAYFAATDDAVHMGFGHTFELTDQKIVQPLAGVVFVDRDETGSRLDHSCISRSCPYNVFH